MSLGIFMPAYNVGKYIEESIDSIYIQSYADWELVIIDDCSEDNTYDQTKMFDSEETHSYRLENHCGKIGKLKNEAIAKLTKTHEYICHVGSDDIIPPYCFQTFIDYMDQHPEVGACCGNFICFNNMGKQWTLPHVANSNEYNSATLLKFNNLFPMRFYRKSVFDQVGGYSNELSSAVDYDLALKIDEITKIHRIKDPITYYYRQHETQVSTKSRKEQDKNAKTALQNALKRRNINAIVKNDAPPFIIVLSNSQLIWGI